MNANRKPMIAANWKMHLNVHQSSILLHRLNERIKIHRNMEIVIAPSMLSLQPLSQQVDRRKFKLAAQDAYPKDEGGYTGEVSFAMIGDMVQYAIVGHSSRRIYFNESLELIRDKVQAAVRCGMKPIICVGETKQERDAGETRRVLHDHITSALANVTSQEVEHIVIAYEPVWAISTFDGVIAKPDDVAKSVEFIRMQIHELYGRKASEDVRILYGGSVDEHDVRGYLDVPGVDGALVGAASLNYLQFTAIVDAAYQEYLKIG